MLDVYASGAYIPALKGHARGAVSVVCHVPEDLELFYAIAELAPRPPSSPLASLAHAISQTSIDWREWWLHWRSLGGRIHQLSESGAPGSNDTGTPVEESKEFVDVEDAEIETLKQVISALYYMWTAHPDDARDLSCCISLALESGTSAPSIEWVGGQPALAFGQGSVWIALGRAGWKARGFLAGLVLGDGIDAASRRAGLVRKARNAAISKVRSAGRPDAADLLNLRDLQQNQIPAGHELCLLLHGLCSTDVGTFDQLEGLIRRRAGNPGNANLTVVGFPHDSLTAGIETNAEELAQLLVRLNARNVRFVCHSRGGLVARRTAALLRQEARRPNWVGPPWIHSCLTFGTPHLGTSAASSPETLTAGVLALAHLSRSPSVSAVADILCSVQAGSTWRSVSELTPVEEKDSCLPLLRRHEEDFLFLDDALPLRVFGSAGPRVRRRRDWKTRLMQRILGTADHDLLVPITSSVPVLRGENAGARLEERNHFEYFSRLDSEPPDPPFWNAALATLGLPTA